MRVRFRISGMFVLSCVLAMLLGALAWLQYHWVGQLSKDDRDRMRAHLRARADDFSDDFNRELTRAFLWLQIGPELRRDQPPEPAETRYERWFTASPHPELIKTIYKVEVLPNGELGLQQFQRNTPRLEKVAWPDELKPMHDRFLAQLREAPTEPGPPQRPGVVMRVPLLWPDLPAIIVPSPRVVRGSGGRIVLQFEPGPGQSYSIAVLNATYLRDQLIPSLVERHLTSERDGNLHVAVRSGDNVIFSTADALPAVMKTPDVVEPLWDIRFNEYNRFVAERQDHPPATSSEPAAAQPAKPGLPAPPNVTYRRGEGPPPAIQVLYGRDDRSRDRDRDHDRDRSRLLGDLIPWYVNVQHPAGSLDAAVANARARNLLVSFGVLLLLGTSMGLVLLSSARARRLAAQQMEFVAGVSHELRTPLAVIRSAAENLADGIVNDEKGVRKYGALIAGEGRRLTQMVEQVMTFAGLQAGRPGFDVRPVDVAPVIDNAVVAMAPFIHERGAEITSEVPPALPMILADAPAVARCLENLIANALKYGGDPVRIQIVARAHRRGVKQVTPGENGRTQRVLVARRSFVEITVQDNGEGIAARDLPHIFEPFYRGADAIAKQIHGSGLGLSLVRRIMEELGGSVTVKTEAGHGSAFTLHLPVAPEAETVAAAASAVPAHGGGHSRS
jgi:signal transduction histidine kinase